MPLSLHVAGEGVVVGALSDRRANDALGELSDDGAGRGVAGDDGGELLFERRDDMRANAAERVRVLDGEEHHGAAAIAERDGAQGLGG